MTTETNTKYLSRELFLGVIALFRNSAKLALLAGADNIYIIYVSKLWGKGPNAQKNVFEFLKASYSIFEL